MEVQKLSVYQFIKSIENLSISDQWLRWMKELEKVSNSPEHHAYLQRFNEYFPFNTKHWTKLAYLELQQGKPQCIKIFQLALAKNPRSISLWKEYFDWLKQTIKESDPDFLMADFQRGLQIIGKHPKSKFIYDYWFQLENTNILKIFGMRKRMLSSILENHKVALEQSLEWVNQLAHQNLILIAKKLNILQTNQTVLKTAINDKFKSYSQESSKKYESIQSFQNTIEFQNYQAYKGNISMWKNYISFTKKHNQDYLESVYQRALIIHCDNSQLWKQYFELLQFKLGKSNRVLDILRSIPYFFKHFDAQLLCYWIEMQETQNIQKARALIVEIENSKPTLQLFLRHVQLQIRANEFKNAKIVYDSILSTFANSIDIISYVVVEYAEFIFKYFREIESSKKLLKVYFQKYFSQYLFKGYIQFYVNHVEFKTGNRELFNEFLEILKTGLKQAFVQLDEDQYKKLYLSVGSLFRSYIPSIFFLKATQKAIKQMQLSLKNSDLQQIKRANNERFQAIQTLSKKRRMTLIKQAEKEQSLY